MGDDMLSRGLRLLMVLADHPDGLGVSAAARAAGLPVSSAHRLLGRLAAERFVAYDARERRYAPGVRVLELARGFHRSPGGYHTALGPMRAMAATSRLPVIAGVLDGPDVLLVLTVQGSQHLQLRSAEGTRNRWHATALGKVLAAGLPDPEREGLLAGPLPAVTPYTRTDPQALRAELTRVRERGWARAEQENEVGVRSVAVPVPRSDGPPVLAVSLGATTVLTGREQLLGHLPELRRCAEDIAARLA